MYRLLGRLESGGLAEWFRAERLGEPGEAPRPVIIKLLHARTSDADYARAAADTARRLSLLTVPGIPRVLEVGSVRGRLAIVREDFGVYTLGQVLRRLLTREVHLPAALALGFVVEVLEVLGQAHAAGVIHGALTPANVLVAANGSPGLSEFGALDALQASAALRKVFAARGRSAYRAPELQGSEKATAASDIYAVGAMAYELLTLREASLGPGAVSTRTAKLPPPSRLVRRLNSRVDAVIMRALEPSPTRRFRACADLSTALRDVLLQEGGVPARGDLEKFVTELFPNEVAVQGLEPAPFTEPFALTELAGVQLRVEGLDDVQVALRNPFSGGEVTERTETVDGMPALTDETAPSLPVVEAPKPAVPASATWDAPAAVMVAPAQARPVDEAALRRRVRVVEDFAVEAKPVAEAFKTPIVEPQPPPKPSQTLVNFVTPFQRTDVPMPPTHEERKARAVSSARVAAAGSTLALMLFVILAGWRWYMVSTDMVGDLIQYLPVPVQRAIGERRPQPGPPPAPPPGPPLKLPDFDKQHPSASPNPITRPVEAPKAPPPPPPPIALKPVPPPPPRSNCYVGAEGAKVGHLAIAVPRGGTAFIDGRAVCGSADHLALSAGVHEVRVTGERGRKQVIYTQRVEAGRTMKLVPVFVTP